jgi:Rod binding domain-containing protein
MLSGISSARFPAATSCGAPPPPPPHGAKDQEVRTKFQQFVGETLYGQALKSMRKTVHKGRFFHGGHGEEVFQQQLDQVLAEKLAQTSGERVSSPMYQLFQLNRR